MMVRKSLRPGLPGTARLVRRFGDRLVCVRYRIDAERMRVVKTAEVIVDEKPWRPSPRAPVCVRIGLDEPVLRGRVKQAGGKWDRERRVWELSYSAVEALGLQDRLVSTT